LSAAIATHRAEQVADETKATDAGQRYAQSLFELTIESNQLTQGRGRPEVAAAMAPRAPTCAA
jgi:F-type H+-transporting ATPase subunit delta